MTSEQLVEQANTSHSPAQLLYLLAMRRPPFLTREGKLSTYSEAIKQLAGSNHRVALQQVLEAVMKDPELQTKDEGSSRHGFARGVMRYAPSELPGALRCSFGS